MGQCTNNCIKIAVVRQAILAILKIHLNFITAIVVIIGVFALMIANGILPMKILIIAHPY